MRCRWRRRRARPGSSRSKIRARSPPGSCGRTGCSRVNGACPDLGLGPVLAGQRFRRGLRGHHRAGRRAPGGGKGPDGGVDYLSVGGYHADGARIHRTLLEAGIGIIEGLDLSPVTAGRYEMICLPVKLHGCDGAPGPGHLAAGRRDRPGPGYASGDGAMKLPAVSGGPGGRWALGHASSEQAGAETSQGHTDDHGCSVDVERRSCLARCHLRYVVAAQAAVRSRLPACTGRAPMAVISRQARPGAARTAAGPGSGG